MEVRVSFALETTFNCKACADLHEKCPDYSESAFVESIMPVCFCSPRYMDELRLPSAIDNSQCVLVAGAGGGFDVYAGIPIYERLRLLGKKVFLANLSFVPLGTTNSQPLTRALYAVESTTTGQDSYFPERSLARFLSQRGENITVYAFEKLGVAPVREGYTHLVQSLGLDAIVLVDGGTDILLRGEEAGLGTPVEDMTSLAAVAAVNVPTRIVACVGFGVDTYHGVCHANWLENVAGLTAGAAFLGATALLGSMPEVRLYLDAVNAAEMANSPRPSIVNGSIASAIEGHFGDYHRTPRTRSNKLFINPLMSLLWAFDLAAVARRNLYLDRLADTQTSWEVDLAIEHFRETVRSRPWESIPH